MNTNDEDKEDALAENNETEMENNIQSIQDERDEERKENSIKQDFSQVEQLNQQVHQVGIF